MSIVTIKIIIILCSDKNQIYMAYSESEASAQNWTLFTSLQHTSELKKGWNNTCMSLVKRTSKPKDEWFLMPFNNLRPYNGKHCFCFSAACPQDHAGKNHSWMNEYLIKAYWNRRSNDLALNHYSLIKKMEVHGEQQNGRYTLETSTCTTGENTL